MRQWQTTACIDEKEEHAMVKGWWWWNDLERNTSQCLQFLWNIKRQSFFLSWSFLVHKALIVSFLDLYERLITFKFLISNSLQYLRDETVTEQILLIFKVTRHTIPSTNRGVRIGLSCLMTDNFFEELFRFPIQQWILSIVKSLCNCFDAFYSIARVKVDTIRYFGLDRNIRRLWKSLA